MFGAALFYGDAVLTPAISVLSAVEGLEVGTQAFTPYVVPIAVGVLVALFALQAQGTETVGRLFGPVTLLWFFAIGAAGLSGILREPAVLARAEPAACAALPHHARSRVLRRPRRGGARGHRRGSAVRRHGALRQGRGAHRLVQPGRAGAGAELLRPGRAVDGRAGSGDQSVLPPAAGLGALSDGGARHRRDGDRVAGRDLRRLFDHPAGDAARLPAAHDHGPHLGQGDRPGLPARA